MMGDSLGSSLDILSMVAPLILDADGGRRRGSTGQRDGQAVLSADALAGGGLRAEPRRPDAAAG